MSADRAVWVKVSASEWERAEWHDKARSAGLTLSDPVRRAVGRGAHVDRGRTSSPSGPRLESRANPSRFFGAILIVLASVADTLEFERRRTSWMIAWAPEDQPTDEQIGAVLHRERGGSRVHVHAARM